MTIKVASIQMAVIENDKAATIAKAEARIRQCRDADLVILPEIWNIGFMSFDRYREDAEDADGPTLSAMIRAARENRVYLHTGSLVEKEDGRYYNSSYLISPEGVLLANYRKIHLFGYNSREPQLLTPGEKVVVVDTPLGRIGMATCFDLRFPELFRRMVDQGAEILLICSAWPYPRLEHWLMLNRVRALENQCCLVSANSTGTNRGTRFVGHSMVIDPWGTITAEGGDRETIVRSQLEMSEVASAREQFPALAARVQWLNASVS
ncbi:MAG: carbon-nitrogen family hydrolase [Desulfobacterales bacterium]